MLVLGQVSGPILFLGLARLKDPAAHDLQSKAGTVDTTPIYQLNSRPQTQPPISLDYRALHIRTAVLIITYVIM